MELEAGNNIVKPIKKPLAKGERSAAGGTWCTVLLPVAGLFLEIFAVDKFSGAALWLTVIVFIWLGCFADFKQISPDLSEDKRAKLKKLRFIPPVYLYVRESMTAGIRTKGLALAMLMAAAAFANGFTQGLLLDETNIPPKLEGAAVGNMDDFKGSDSTIGDKLEAWFDEGKYDISCTHTGDIFSVTFSGTREGAEAAVTIDIEHDGFAYKEISPEKIVLGGSELDDEDFDKTLKEIFADETEESEESE
ncbi:hypothetical protein [Ruminococcus sp.]|uniref:hypothetical protein n=1 Tax=Ruminococcus sp. TaxID=41978 RepID=UPI0025E48246|nr:hypothetical protein [Ruminococcus sp.]MBQ8966125.1 hypothetical protein [Ruminococcus sp.]